MAPSSPIAKRTIGSAASWHPDVDALRLLAPRPCHPPCHRGQPRPPRYWRCRYADRARISGAFALGPAEISALPPPAGHVRCWTNLSVSPATPHTSRPDAQGLAHGFASPEVTINAADDVATGNITYISPSPEPPPRPATMAKSAVATGSTASLRLVSQ